MQGRDSYGIRDGGSGAQNGPSARLGKALKGDAFVGEMLTRMLRYAR